MSQRDTDLWVALFKAALMGASMRPLSSPLAAVEHAEKMTDAAFALVKARQNSGELALKEPGDPNALWLDKDGNRVADPNAELFGPMLETRKKQQAKDDEDSSFAVTR